VALGSGWWVVVSLRVVLVKSPGRCGTRAARYRGVLCAGKRVRGWVGMVASAACGGTGACANARPAIDFGEFEPPRARPRLPSRYRATALAVCVRVGEWTSGQRNDRAIRAERHSGRSLRGFAGMAMGPGMFFKRLSDLPACCCLRQERACTMVPATESYVSRGVTTSHERYAGS
jgi:hypothetical protein